MYNSPRRLLAVVAVAIFASADDVAPFCESPTLATRVLSPADECWVPCCRGLAHSACSQVCRSRVRKAWRSVAQAHERGTAKSRKLGSAAAEKPANLSRRLVREAEARHAEAAELTRAFERAVHELQGGGRMTPDAMARLQASQGAVHAAQSDAHCAAARARIDWSAPGFAALAGAGCFASPPVSEKLFKGGSTTAVAKSYRFAVCPFFNVTQVEEDPGAWGRAEAAAKSEEGALRVGADGAAAPVGADPEAQAAAAQRSVPLGYFRGWLPDADAHAWATGALELPRQSPPPVLPRPPASDAGPGAVGDAAEYYDLPWDTCRAGPNAPTTTRRAYVHYICPGLTPRQHAAAASLVRRPWPARAPQGDSWDVPAPAAAGGAAAGGEPVISHVLEDGLCTYRLWVSTPLACSRSVAVAALQVAQEA